MERQRNKLGHYIKGHTENVGRRCSEKQKRQISIANKNRIYPTGWYHSKKTREKIGLAHLGEKSVCWVSKNPSYSSVHRWLDRHFKKEKKCEFCGSNRFIEWALRKGKKHDHKRENYLCLCSSCHKKYDYTLARRRRLSASLKLVPHTKEWCKKISIANKGRKLSEKQKKQLSEYQKKHPRPRNKEGRFCKK